MSHPKLENFKITKKISQRLCFTVYEATEFGSENRLYLKILDPELSKDEAQVLQFLGGARLIKNLRHPGISRIFDFGKDGSYYYIATQPIEIASLQSLVREQFALAFPEFAEILAEIARTLRHAHLHGVVHGFLNPECIFIDSSSRIRIEDFGFSWCIPHLFQTKKSVALQLAPYLAPEFYTEAGELDGRADIYSLGAILLTFLTGTAPFSGKSLEEIQSQQLSGKLPEIDMDELGLPEGLHDVIEKMTASARERRFRNMKEVVNALQALTGKSGASRGQQSFVPEYAEDDLAFEPALAEKYFVEEPETVEPDRMQLLRSFSGAIVNRVRSWFALPGIRYATGAAGAALLLTLLLSSIGIGPFAGKEDGQSGFPGMQVQPSALDEIQEEPAAINNGGETESENAPPGRNSETGGQPSGGISEPAAGLSNSSAIGADSLRPEMAEPPAPVTLTVDLLVTADGRPLPGATIFVDGQPAGRSDARGRVQLSGLEPGQTYTARVSREEYQTRTRQFVAAADAPRVQIELPPRPATIATLNLEAIPGADSVFVDGVLQQVSPPAQLKLPPGEHNIRLVNSELNLSYAQRVDLRENQVLRLRHDFTKTEFGRVAISLRNAAEFGFGFVYVDGELWPGPHNTTPLELRLPAGRHTISVRRDGFDAIPQEVIVEVEADETKYVAFTFLKRE